MGSSTNTERDKELRPLPPALPAHKQHLVRNLVKSLQTGFQKRMQVLTPSLSFSQTPENGFQKRMSVLTPS